MNENTYSLDDVQVVNTLIGLSSEANKGDKCCGEIVSVEVFQDTDFTTKEPLVYANGTPKLKSKIKLNCFENTMDESLKGQEVAIYVKHYGDNWQNFTAWMKTQDWWKNDMKISDILKPGVYVEYVFEGKGKGQTRDGRAYQYNKFTLTVEVDKK